MLLLLPKVLGARWRSLIARLREGFGGAVRLSRVCSLEQVFSMLLAPAMMLFHASFVASRRCSAAISAGRTQTRDDRGIPWDTRSGPSSGTRCSAVVGAPSALWIPRSFIWLSPLVTGLLLSAPLSVLTSRARRRAVGAARGAPRDPQERHQPAIIASASALAVRLERTTPPQTDGLARVIADPLVNAVHLALLPGSGDAGGDPRAVAEARRKLVIGPTGIDTSNLSRADKIALLFDAPTLTELHLAARRPIFPIAVQQARLPLIPRSRRSCTGSPYSAANRCSTRNSIARM